MSNEMFCFQCEQTAGCTGCTGKAGVCGKKSDTAIQYVQKWMPIVAASQSLKGNEAEKDFLSSWVNVVDYT